MRLSPELEHWNKLGQYFQVAPLACNVFAIDLGDCHASSKDTCLLIHGFPESSFSFHKVVHGLLGQFKRLVLIDLPGYGFSDKPEDDYSYSLVAQADAMLSVWHQMGVQGGHIICHDMGTSVATELLARSVNKLLPHWIQGGINSVTFTNGSMVLRFAKLRLMQKLLLNKTLGPTISSLAGSAAFKRTVLSAHGASGEHALDEQDVRLLWESCCLQRGEKKNHHLIRYLNDRRRFESTRWLPSLKIASRIIPTHFCWGDADQVATIEMARHLQEEICPDSLLTEMKGAGHFCQLGSPELWLDSVGPFYD